MVKRKTEIDLGKLADEANDALAYLVTEGYEKEVQVVRAFLMAQGEHWRKIQRIQHDIASTLSRQLKAKRGDPPDA